MDRGDYDFCVGSANPVMKRQLTGLLNGAGFYATGAASSIPEMLRLLRTVQPWLAVIDMELPPGNVAQLASIVEDDGLAAALYLGAPDHRIKRYPQLPWPVAGPVLTAVAEAVCREFVQKKKLQQNVEELKRQLAGRREIEKAKAIIMETAGIGEAESYRRLQRLSMDRRIPLVEAARQIIGRGTPYSP